MEPDKKETQETDKKVNARKKMLINEMKKTYLDFHDGIHPIPFTDRLLHVNEVFFDSGIEVLVMKGLQESWEKLSSRHFILKDSRKKSTRFILLGEHGVGKSTLAKQLAYDWRCECKDSPLREVEIFISLQLSKINNSTSIFDSIKHFLLSYESKLTAKDVEEILNSATSVVMILQDFDKYIQSKEKDKVDDVSKIIKGQMFPDFPVILTTTPSCIPIGMPQSTVKVRLIGFDSDARNKYFRKALESNEEQMKVMKIQSEIEDNPMIRDLCKVPFFYGIVLNLISEGNIPFSFNTITKFFRYMIGSFFEQMKNKLRNEVRKRYSTSGIDHRKLDKVSFETLTEKNQEDRWIKEELRRSIGGALYDQYVAVGILVEEKVVKINESPNTPTSSLLQVKTQTRFYHSIFLQWFAAHYISNQARSFNFENKLQKLCSSSDLQYVFQFACGINDISCSKIINYLQKRGNNSKLVNLCLLEQEECHKSNS